MGKLRTVPKIKTLGADRYREFMGILREAHRCAEDSHVFWDLDEDEDGVKAKKDFLYVAQKEDIPLKIRQPRKSRSFQFMFSEPEIKPRLSADDAKERILDVLKSSSRPMKKGEILSATGISTSSWNMRIRELTDENRVCRKGNRRDTVYLLT